MKPKEKARFLYMKFCNYNSENPKEIALHICDELIEFFWKTHKNEFEFRYWQQVKQEIQVL
jgi:hypothetical protein